MKYSILYRGPLKSCNYTCYYCPFAKTKASSRELDADRQALDRFTDWLCTRSSDRISVMFTPWGEALIYHYYQNAITTLSHLPHLEKVVIQTNLSCRLDWLDDCHSKRIALWCSYHPGQVEHEAFLGKCLELDHRGIRFSVGAVALKEHKHEIQTLRRQLPEHIYLWLNAYKDTPNYYTEDDICFFESIDPFFRINTRVYPSQRRACRCGESVISVYGNGDIQRCYFIKETLGNIYASGIESALKKRPCTNPTCHCHIGYVHMNDLNLYALFQDGILERIPYNYFSDLRGISDLQAASYPI